MSSEEKTEDANNGDKSPVPEEESVDELSLLKKELEDMNDKFARSMADLDNFKKRIERDREQQNLKSRGLAVSSFLEVVEIFPHQHFGTCRQTTLFQNHEKSPNPSPACRTRTAHNVLRAHSVRPHRRPRPRSITDSSSALVASRKVGILSPDFSYGVV